MKIIICLNTAWNLLNFRAGLIRALVAEGYEVVAVAPYDSYADQLPQLGCRYLALPMDNQGTNPVKDLMLTWHFFCLFWRERPDVYLGYTVKPNVYGSLAAHVLKIPVINNIAGLGAVFIKDGWLASLVRKLYWLALKPSAHVFFQNNDDLQLFTEGGLVNPSITELLPGSGIDLSRFSYKPMPSKLVSKGKFRFLLIARMLWDKGVGEFVQAARLLKQEFTDVEFCLLGFVDVQNPAAISGEQISEWVADGVINYLGISNDVRKEIEDADCIVLPSYREGTPRTLLEAAAIGRPIVTTNATGCREVVDDGDNGFLCKVRDADDLAVKMRSMLLLTDKELTKMGQMGRKKMEQQFDEKIVIGKYLAAIDKLLE